MSRTLALPSREARYRGSRYSVSIHPRHFTSGMMLDVLKPQMLQGSDSIRGIFSVSMSSSTGALYSA